MWCLNFALAAMVCAAGFGNNSARLFQHDSGALHSLEDRPA